MYISLLDVFFINRYKGRVSWRSESHPRSKAIYKLYWPGIVTIKTYIILLITLCSTPTWLSSNIWCHSKMHCPLWVTHHSQRNRKHREKQTLTLVLVTGEGFPWYVSIFEKFLDRVLTGGNWGCSRKVDFQQPLWLKITVSRKHIEQFLRKSPLNLLI